MILAERVTGRYRATLCEYQGGLRQAWHVHDHAVIVLILRGGCREATRRGEVAPDPFVIGIKTAGLDHTDHFGPGSLRAIRVCVPADALPGHDWEWRREPAAIRALCRVGWTLLASDGGDLEGDLGDAVAAIQCGEYRQRHAPPAWLARAREELLDRNGAPRLAELALRAGVHPVYFASRFRAHFGRSVGAVRREIRLARALREIGTATPLSGISVRAGFADQAHLTREVRRELGITPARLRRLIGH